MRLIPILVIAALAAVPVLAHHADGQQQFLITVIDANPKAPATVGIGESLTITIFEPDGRTGVAAVTAEINGVDVARSFKNEGNGRYTFTYTVAAEHTSIPGDQDLPVNIKMRDGSGSESQTILAISSGFAPGIDAGTPTLSAPKLTKPAPGSTVSEKSQKLEGTTQAGTNVLVQLDGGSTLNMADVTGTTWTYNIMLNEGSNRITLTASTEDTSVSETVFVTLDSMPPSAPTLTSHNNGSTINHARPILSGATDAGTDVTVELDDSGTQDADVTGTGWSYPAILLRGANIITVTASDTAGNEASATFEITYDVMSAVDRTDYDGMPEHSGGYSCSSQHQADTSRLPEFTLAFPDLLANEDCPDYDGASRYALVYRILDTAPHEMVHMENITVGSPATINLDDDKFGFGDYEIYYFVETDAGTLLVGLHEVEYAIIATMTLAPPPPVITSPANGTQFSPLSNTGQTVTGTATPGLDVKLTITALPSSRSYNLPGDSDPAWSSGVTLYEGENRITAVAVASEGLESRPAEIIVHVVDADEVIPPPVITHPANGTTFAFDDRVQDINGTHAGDTLRLRVAHIVNGSEADAATYSEGTDNSTHWNRLVQLYDGENRLTAVAVRGTAESAPSEAVTLFVGPENPVCSADVTSDLAFGTLKIGDTSRDGTMTFANTGNQASIHMLQGTDWVNPAQTTQVVMDVSQTRYHDTASTAYSAKTALTAMPADALEGLGPGASEELYLQVRVALDRPTFAGDVQQKITVTSSCDHSNTQEPSS